MFVTDIVIINIYTTGERERGRDIYYEQYSEREGGRKSKRARERNLLETILR
jgi:hypothetical protein